MTFHSDTTIQQVLLKDIITRALVAIEASHTHRLTPEEVKEVLESIKEEEASSVQSRLLDTMYEYYADVNELEVSY